MLLRASYQQISPSERDLITDRNFNSREHKFLRLVLKEHSPKRLAGFINEPVEVF